MALCPYKKVVIAQIFFILSRRHRFGNECQRQPPSALVRHDQESRPSPSQDTLLECQLHRLILHKISLLRLLYWLFIVYYGSQQMARKTLFSSLTSFIPTPLWAPAAKSRKGIKSDKNHTCVLLSSHTIPPCISKSTYCWTLKLCQKTYLHISLLYL